MKKLVLRIVLGVVVLIVLLAVITPMLVNADSFRPTLESQLTQALGRKVTLGHLSFSLFSGSVKANDIAIADDPAFSQGVFIKAKELSVGVELLPLVFSRSLHVTKLILDSPSIQMIQTPKGVWNFSSLGASGGSAPSKTSAGTPAISVAELKIKDGSATVSSLPAKGQPFVYSDINLSVDHLSLTESFPFELKAKLPAQGEFELKGKAGPAAAGNIAATPFHAELEVKHFDPVGAGAVDRSAGISMTVDVQAQADSDGKTLSSKGRIVAQNLHLARTGAPAKKPVAIDYDTALALAERKGKVNDVAVHAGQVAAHLRGGFELTEKGANLDLRLSAPGLPIDQVVELLPAAGVTLPEGSKLEGGTLSADLAIKGPVAGLVITGPVDVENTKLDGFDIGSKMQGVNPFGGKGGGTKIQTLKAVVTNTSAMTKFNDINAVLPQVGSATGNGTVSSSEQLNFDLLGKFEGSTGIGAVTGKVVTGALSGVGKAAGLFGKLGKQQPAQTQTQPKNSGAIPVSITGTAAKPVIRVKFGQMFKQ